MVKFWVKARMPRGGVDAENGESVAAIRVRERASPDGDILPAISTEILGKSPTIHLSPKWILFFNPIEVGNFVGFRVEIRISRVWIMPMPKMGNR